MRTVIESKQTLVVEEPGKIAPIGFVVLVVVHLLIFIPIIRETYVAAYQHGLAWFMVFISSCIYAILGFLAFGRFRDKTTTTFHGGNKVVIIEKHLPLGVHLREEIPFSEFEKFEVLSPEAGGACNILFAGGESRRLVRLRSYEELEVMKRLEAIVRKPVEVYSI